jgi:hypothetical protein
VAEIHLERKQGAPAWIWVVVAIVVIALLAWLLWPRGETTTTAFETDAGQIVSPTPTGGAGDFRAFLDDQRARADMGREHEYTAEGVRRLASALGDVSRNAGMHDQVEPRLDEMRQHADALQREEDSQQHANHARAAFTAGASVMRDLQPHYPDAQGQITQVEQAAQQVNAGTPLLEQRAAVQSYFDQAANALDRMHGASHQHPEGAMMQPGAAGQP